MTRNEFLTELDRYLVTLDQGERADIISDYEEHFRVGLENGKTEAEIAASLGSPYDVASQFLDGESQQRQSYNTQRGYNQGQSYNTQQGYGQRQSYNAQQGYNQGQNYNTQHNSDAYSVPYERQDYPQSGSKYDTTGIIVVVILCVVLIPTVGSMLIGLLAGLYGSVIGFAAAGTALITTGAALPTGISILLSVGLIMIGVSFLALAGLLIMASVEATKLFIKLVKYCIKECKKMITEGSF